MYSEKQLKYFARRLETGDVSDKQKKMFKNAIGIIETNIETKEIGIQTEMNLINEKTPEDIKKIKKKEYMRKFRARKKQELKE